ncbi:MAG: glycosyltransferase family 2 protein [Erysipelotrichaceae bacterium]|nr:glycosyltransferase family 2 protein [Erysipelotrichaceae bacterium]
MKLSIILPVYNLPNLTKRALDSIPFDEDLEVIVVNDGSTDDMSFIKEYPVKYISYDENVNVGHARNIALNECRGEYIYGLDNDDYLYTEEFREAMKELDGTDMVFVNVKVNGGFVLELNEQNKHHYCAFWSKFVRRDLIGNTRCLEAQELDDYYFNEEIMKKPHTEKYTGIVAYHYNFPREGSIIWKRNHL